MVPSAGTKGLAISRIPSRGHTKVTAVPLHTVNPTLRFLSVNVMGSSGSARGDAWNGGQAIAPCRWPLYPFVRRPSRLTSQVLHGVVQHEVEHLIVPFEHAFHCKLHSTRQRTRPCAPSTASMPPFPTHLLALLRASRAPPGRCSPSARWLCLSWRTWLHEHALLILVCDRFDRCDARVRRRMCPHPRGKENMEALAWGVSSLKEGPWGMAMALHPSGCQGRRRGRTMHHGSDGRAGRSLQTNASEKNRTKREGG